MKYHREVRIKPSRPEREVSKKRKNVFLNIKHKPLLDRFEYYQKLRRDTNQDEKFEALKIPKFIQYQIKNKKKFRRSFLFPRRLIEVNGSVGFRIPLIDCVYPNFVIGEEYFIQSISWERKLFVVHLKLKKQNPCFQIDLATGARTLFNPKSSGPIF